MNVFGNTYLIKSGDMAGFFLRAAYGESTGGYYIFYSRDFSDPAAEGYDEWYEHREDVERVIGSLDQRCTEGEKP